MTASITTDETSVSLIERLKRAQLRLAAVALLVMMMTTVADVFLRYTFNRPIRGSYDLVESTLVVFVFHGIAAVFCSRQNIVIDLVDSVLGRRAVGLLIRLSDVLSIAALAILVWAMMTPARQAFDYGDRKLELGLPLSVLWAFALSGMAGTILCALAALVGRTLPGGKAQAR
jgi:TRAP-type C4-dicarboxylate transport system permease small subunit